MERATTIAGRSEGEPTIAIWGGTDHRGKCGQDQERVRVGLRPCPSPVRASHWRAHAHIDRIVVVAAAGRRRSDLVAYRACHRGGLYHSGSMVPAIVVGMLMAVVVAMAAEMDVRAAPMIGRR